MNFKQNSVREKLRAAPRFHIEKVLRVSLALFAPSAAFNSERFLTLFRKPERSSSGVSPSALDLLRFLAIARICVFRATPFEGRGFVHRWPLAPGVASRWPSTPGPTHLNS